MTSGIAEHTVSARGALALHNHVFPRIIQELKDEIEPLKDEIEAMGGRSYGGEVTHSLCAEIPIGFHPPSYFDEWFIQRYENETNEDTGEDYTFKGLSPREALHTITKAEMLDACKKASDYFTQDDRYMELEWDYYKNVMDILGLEGN